MTGPILFLIPARGGSRRVPGKNLRHVGGIPLVGRAARTARAAAALLPGGPHCVVCSTDDPAIAAAAAAWGAEVLDRPPALAADEAGSVDVALHALEALEAREGGVTFETLVLVQPTSPLIEPADLAAVVERHRASSGAPVTTVSAAHPASWHQGMDATGVLHPVAPAAGEDVLLAGAAYAVSPWELRAARRLVIPGRTLGQVIPADRAIDVDEERDLLAAEAMLRSGSTPPPPPVVPAAATGRPAAGPASGRLAGGRDGSPRVVTVLTTGRQDWGILRSTCEAIRAHPGLRLDLVVGGMHLSAQHGHTVDLVRADGFEPASELRWLSDDGSAVPLPEVQAAAALEEVGGHVRLARSDVLLIAGDRFETAAAALAATLAAVPIAHLHGGEQTLGAFDDALRHAITKLAHLHMVSNDEHARRVVAMGEDPAAVHVVGVPGNDGLERPDLATREELEERLGLTLRAPVVAVTVHPATLDADPAAAARAVTRAMDEVPATYVITLPNVDPGAAEVRRLLEAAASDRPDRVTVSALGERRYWGLLRLADAMLGNSSSGLAEAPALGLPAVNVGDRQAGRHRAANVVDVPADPEAIVDALRRVLTPGYRATLPIARAEPDDGPAGVRVAAIIAAWHPLRPPRKPPVPV